MKKLLACTLVITSILSSQIHVFAQPIVYSKDTSPVLIAEIVQNNQEPIKLDNQGPYDPKYYRKLTKKEQKCLIALGLGTLELTTMNWAGVIRAAGTIAYGCYYD